MVPLRGLREPLAHHRHVRGRAVRRRVREAAVLPGGGVVVRARHEQRDAGREAVVLGRQRRVRVGVGRGRARAEDLRAPGEDGELVVELFLLDVPRRAVGLGRARLGAPRGVERAVRLVLEAAQDGLPSARACQRGGARVGGRVGTHVRFRGAPVQLGGHGEQVARLVELGHRRVRQVRAGPAGDDDAEHDLRTHQHPRGDERPGGGWDVPRRKRHTSRCSRSASIWPGGSRTAPGRSAGWSTPRARWTGRTARTGSG